jgi:hypothetical protein
LQQSYERNPTSLARNDELLHKSHSLDPLGLLQFWIEDANDVGKEGLEGGLGRLRFLSSLRGGHERKNNENFEVSTVTKLSHKSFVEPALFTSFT